LALTNIIVLLLIWHCNTLVIILLLLVIINLLLLLLLTSSKLITTKLGTQISREVLLLLLRILLLSRCLIILVNKILRFWIVQLRISLVSCSSSTWLQLLRSYIGRHQWVLVFHLSLINSISGPVDTITQWFTTTTENREWPEPLIQAENLLPVVTSANIINRLVFLAFLIQVLDCSLVCQSDFQVEL